MKKAIGIDISGTKIAAGIVTDRIKVELASIHFEVIFILKIDVYEQLG